MGIAKRLHQEVIEGRISHDRAEQQVTQLLTRPGKAKPGAQLALFGQRGEKTLNRQLGEKSNGAT